MRRGSYHSLRTGLSFGITSGIITTLGLMVGLSSGTHSKFVVMGGILTIAIADSFSDALGIHLSEESEKRHTTWEIWESTLYTFAAKFLFTLSFIIPVLIFDLPKAVVVAAIWGLSALAMVSFIIARGREKVWKSIAEHLIVALLVIALTHYTGEWISATFC